MLSDRELIAHCRLPNIQRKLCAVVEVATGCCDGDRIVSGGRASASSARLIPATAGNQEHGAEYQKHED
jgi:hypothetical protein